MTFRLAPMSPLILTLTLALLALPVVFFTLAACALRLLAGPATFLVLIYTWIWLWFRPTEFVVHPATLEIVWPLRRQELRRDSIASVRLVDRAELRRDVGRAMRVGAGGMWGGFGWLWTEKRGVVRMYVSRTDGLVWIERGGGERPWLLTPERPDAFARALSGL